MHLLCVKEYFHVFISAYAYTSGVIILSFDRILSKKRLIVCDQEPICNECLLVEHKAPEHQYERLTDAEPRQKEELINLMTESKTKISECDQVTVQLENALSELQVQHDQAKDLITETFQSYKAILEKCKDNALVDLEKLHSNRELEIMDAFHKYACCLLNDVITY